LGSREVPERCRHCRDPDRRRRRCGFDPDRAGCRARPRSRWSCRPCSRRKRWGRPEARTSHSERRAVVAGVADSICEAEVAWVVLCVRLPLTASSCARIHPIMIRVAEGHGRWDVGIAESVALSRAVVADVADAVVITSRWLELETSGQLSSHPCLRPPTQGLMVFGSPSESSGIRRCRDRRRRRRRSDPDRYPPGKHARARRG